MILSKICLNFTNDAMNWLRRWLIWSKSSVYVYKDIASLCLGLAVFEISIALIVFMWFQLLTDGFEDPTELLTYLGPTPTSGEFGMGDDILSLFLADWDIWRQLFCRQWKMLLLCADIRIHLYKATFQTNSLVSSYTLIPIALCTFGYMECKVHWKHTKDRVL